MYARRRMWKDLMSADKRTPKTAASAAEELPTQAQVEVAVSTLGLLADPTRLRILWLLARGEREVGQLSDLTGATASATSQHLAKLRLAGLVSVRKQGRNHIYSTRGVHVRNLINEALYYADHRVSGEPDHD
jgi:DNA-binding transcriptional ArsR family regulator